MAAIRFLLPALALSTLSLLSCSDSGKGGAVTKPILLGDSSTIVTETDATLLEDIVPPLNVPENNNGADEKPGTATLPPDSGTATAPTVETPSPAAPVQQPTAAGYTVDFGEVKVTLVGGNIRADNRKFSGSNSASIVADKSSYAGTAIQITGGTVSKVQQRAQVAVVASRGNEVLPLPDLGNGTTAWQSLRQQGSSWAMAPTSDVSFRNANNNTIRNAVQRAAQKKKLSRAAQQEWANAVKNVRSVGQAPVQTALRSVTWRIDGKDSQGKAFSKEVRVDMPL